MSKEMSLHDFLQKQTRTMSTAWIESLPDYIYNQLWDAFHDSENSIGKVTASKWLDSIGYPEATAGRIDAILIRERRK